MERDYAVEFQDVSKIYKVKRKNSQGKKEDELFYALRDVNFKVEKGDIVGVFGTNGSGKSTTAKLLSGILAPDKGEVNINGESALIAINSGLDNQLTGIENIELKAVLLGFDKKKIQEITDQVIEFSELGDFIYQPVKSYSSGMKSRLGFAISINIDADIVIIDEALSVGDTAFNEKCFRKIVELKERGKTIFFVSHSFRELKKYCTKGLWIEAGMFKCYDDIDVVAEYYKNFIVDYKKKTHAQKKQYRNMVYESRIGLANEKNENNKPKKKRKKREILLTTIIAIILLVFVGVAYSSRTKPNDNNVVEEVEEPSKKYDYIFVVNGKMNLVNGRYRDYIIEDGKIVNDIIHISIDEETKDIKISKLPKDIQYYYEEKDIYDELDIIYPIKSDKEKLKTFFEELMDKKVTDLYELDENDLIKALKSISCDLSFKDNKSVWNIDGKENVVNREWEDGSENQAEPVYSNLISKIESLDDEKINSFIKEIIGEEDKVLIDSIKLIKDEDYNTKVINTSDDYGIKVTPLEDILKEYDKENTEQNIVLRDLIYKEDLVDLAKNIFVKKSKEANMPVDAGVSENDKPENNTTPNTGNGSNNSGSNNGSNSSGNTGGNVNRPTPPTNTTPPTTQPTPPTQPSEPTPPTVDPPTETPTPPVEPPVETPTPPVTPPVDTSGENSAE